MLIRERDCVLFDLDGTLVDSSPYHERAYLKALEERLPELARNFRYEVCKGLRTRDALRMYGVEDENLLSELTEAKQRAYRAQVEAGAVQFIPYGRELLDALRKGGARLFVVTGGSARSTRTVLNSLGIAEWFEHVVTADDVTHGKPAPNCWLECVRRASIDVARALVVEDALSGIESARAAGLACIAVNNVESAGLPEYAGSLRDVLKTLTAGGGA